MNKQQHKKRSFTVSICIAIVALLGFGNSNNDDGVIPFAHADTPHENDDNGTLDGNRGGSAGSGASGSSNSCGSRGSAASGGGACAGGDSNSV